MKIKYDQPITILNSYKSILGQRPLWDWRHGKFYWIDINEKILIENDPLFEKEIKFLIPEGINVSPPGSRLIKGNDNLKPPEDQAG